MKRYGAFLSEESKTLLTSVRNFVDKEMMPVRIQLDESREACEVIIDKLVKMGMQRYGLSPKYGGVQIGSAVEYVAVCEELARGDSGIATEMTCPEWLFGPAMRARNKAVLEKLMTPFCSDERHTACFALTEPAGGCNGEDPTQRGKALKTIARLDGAQWVINGSKRWPGGAGIAEVYGILCTTDPSLGEEGVALIYVPAAFALTSQTRNKSCVHDVIPMCIWITARAERIPLAARDEAVSRRFILGTPPQRRFRLGQRAAVSKSTSITRHRLQGKRTSFPPGRR
jgi:alkylation response protein AidB-like acyl-CoA dehydrogenase